MKYPRIIGRGLAAQSGGPTAVINSSLVGVIKAALAERDIITDLWGSVNSVEGILRKDCIDLYRQNRRTIERVMITPGAALGSSRKKIGKDIKESEILEVFKKYDIRYFFLIGGNDSADNAKAISELAKNENYDMRVFHIPKTVDDDLLKNDHTPGYGSAALYVARVFMGDNYDNLSLPGVKINVVMGRNAGFLTAASALARREGRKDDAPHLIYLPERQFVEKKFLEDLAGVLKENKRAVIAVAEGIENENGRLIGWNGKTFDSHGNPELDALYLARRLTKLVKKSGISTRVRADVLGYPQRCFAGCVSEQDRKEAKIVGIKAVEAAISGDYESGSIALKRMQDSEGRYSFYTRVVPLKSVAKNTKKMPSKFINSKTNDVTPAFIRYAKPLVGKLPKFGSLKYINPIRG